MIYVVGDTCDVDHYSLALGCPAGRLTWVSDLASVRITPLVQLVLVNPHHVSGRDIVRFVRAVPKPLLCIAVPDAMDPELLAALRRFASPETAHALAA